MSASTSLVNKEPANQTGHCPPASTCRSTSSIKLSALASSALLITLINLTALYNPNKFKNSNNPNKLNNPNNPNKLNNPNNPNGATAEAVLVLDESARPREADGCAHKNKRGLDLK